MIDSALGRGVDTLYVSMYADDVSLIVSMYADRECGGGLAAVERDSVRARRGGDGSIA